MAFGKSGEFAGKYFRKGMKVAVEGRIQSRSYENKDGHKVNAVEIVAENQEFCEKREGNSNTVEYAPVAAPANDSFAPITGEFDDMPF